MTGFKHNSPGERRPTDPSGEGSLEDYEARRRELASRAAGAISEFTNFQNGWESDPRDDPQPETPPGRAERRDDEFWPDGRRRERLPIDERLAEIGELLRDHQVVVVEAPPGSGKTTRIPPYLALKHPDHNVITTQNRRNAVRWIGARVAAEAGTRPGGWIGWRLARESPVVSRETRLTFMIAESLVNKIRKRGGRPPSGIIVVDEAHERSITTDLLLGLLKEGLPASPEARVVITSATIDTRKFSDFFGEAPVVSAQGRMFPVSTEVVRLERLEHHTQGAARAARSIIERFSNGTLEVPTEDGVGTKTVREGTVIVLLPGKDDIRDVVSSIQEHAKKIGAGRVEALSCHGWSTPEEQDAAQKPVGPGVIRFVCGTEILRSSVTLPKTIGTIDSLQVKRLTSDARGVGHLAKIPVSRAEADQGRGRAGRTGPGFYMPVSFGEEYEHLNPYPTPAILQEPITNFVLQVAAVGRSARDFPLMDRPEAAKIDVAITRLERIGAIDHDGRITETGETLVGFSLDPERAKTLVAAERLGVLPEAVIAAALLEEGNVFFHPNERGEEGRSRVVEEPILRRLLSLVERDGTSDYWNTLSKPRDPAIVDLADLPRWVKKRDDHWEIDTRDYQFPSSVGPGGIARLVREQWGGPERSDFAAIVRAYRAFKAEERRLKDANPPKGGRESPGAWRRRALQEWCERWFINQRQMRRAEDIMRQLLDDISASPLRMHSRIADERAFDGEALTKALIAGLTDNVARRVEGKRSSGFSGPIVGDTDLFQIGRESACPGDQPFVITGGVHKVPTRRQGFFYLADFAAPVKTEWLQEMMPHLYTSRREADAAYDPAADAVIQTETSFYGDFELCRERVQAPYTAENGRLFAQWLAGPNASRLVRNEALRVILEENKTQLRRAESLNLRSGRAEFPEYSPAELGEFYAQRIGAAASAAEIERPQDLRLPGLDAGLVERVLEDHPDTLRILGSETAITYERGQAENGETGRNSAISRAYLGNLSEGNRWLELPDEGIRLPGGSFVEISFVLLRKNDWMNQRFSGRDIPDLKQKAAEYLNRSVWDAWKERPAISVPDPRDEHARIPEIAEVFYGVSVVDGETPLRAYGTVTVNAGRYRTTDPVFSPAWFPTRSEAERARAAAEAELKRAKNELRDAEDLRTAMEAARKAQDELRQVYEMHYMDEGLDRSLRNLLRDRSQGSLPPDAGPLRAWTDEARALAAEVERAVAETRQRKEEEGRNLRRWARQIPVAGIPDAERTAYGMPCDGEGKPCEAAAAAGWRLYTLRDGSLVPQSRSEYQYYGSTFAELAADYLGNDPEAEAALRNLLPPDAFQQRNPDPVLGAVHGDITAARRGREFAETVRSLLGGNTARALSILEREAEAPYGRARRQAAIQQNVRGIEATDIGGLFGRLGRAEDVYTILKGAIAHLRNEAPRSGSPDDDKRMDEMPSAEPAPESSLSTIAEAFRAASAKNPEPREIEPASPPEAPADRLERPAAVPRAERTWTPERQEELERIVERERALLRAMDAGPRPAEGSSRNARSRIKEYDAIEARLKELKRVAQELADAVSRESAPFETANGQVNGLPTAVSACAARIERFGGPRSAWLDAYREHYRAIPREAEESADVSAAVELGISLADIIARAREELAAAAADLQRGGSFDSAAAVGRAAENLTKEAADGS